MALYNQVSVYKCGRGSMHAEMARVRPSLCCLGRPIGGRAPSKDSGLFGQGFTTFAVLGVPMRALCTDKGAGSRDVGPARGGRTMQCPYCGSRTEVIEKRGAFRDRRCMRPDCRQRFTTREQVMNSLKSSVKPREHGGMCARTRSVLIMASPAQAVVKALGVQHRTAASCAPRGKAVEELSPSRETEAGA